MEFSLSLAAGTAGGLAASLLLRLLWQYIVIAPAPAASRPGWSEAQYVLLHASWGAGLGLLFWLSWGLTALIGVAWWVRGLAFGGLCGIVLALPVLFMARLLSRWSWLLIVGLVFDAFSTSLMAGLLCAWSWTHTP